VTSTKRLSKERNVLTACGLTALHSIFWASMSLDVRSPPVYIPR
jgi:hypothetical protein